MNHTQNLHLPQWEKTDRIMMDDFNDAMSKIDAAIKICPIADIKTADSSSEVILDVSDVDFTRYSKVYLNFQVSSTYSIFLYLNDLSQYYGTTGIGNYNLSNISSSVMAELHPDRAEEWMFPSPRSGANVILQCTSAEMNSSQLRSAVFYRAAPIRWEALTSLKFTSNHPIPAGSHFSLVGVLI